MSHDPALSFLPPLHCGPKLQPALSQCPWVPAPLGSHTVPLRGMSLGDSIPPQHLSALTHHSQPFPGGCLPTATHRATSAAQIPALPGLALAHSMQHTEALTMEGIPLTPLEESPPPAAKKYPGACPWHPNLYCPYRVAWPQAVTPVPSSLSAPWWQSSPAHWQGARFT